MSDRAIGVGAAIIDHVTQMVMTGRWPIGMRVASEAELARTFAASRMTVHHALRELTRRGLLTRRRGDGTFVAPPSRYISPYDHLDIRDEILARGGVHRAQVLRRDLVAAPPAEAALFAVAAGTRLFHAVIVHHEDGRPIELEDRWLNPLVLPDCMEIDLAERSLFARLMMIRPYRQGTESVAAILADAETQALLGLDPAEPCLEIRRRTWTPEMVVTSARIVRASARAAMQGVIAPEVGP